MQILRTTIVKGMFFIAGLACLLIAQPAFTQGTPHTVVQTQQVRTELVAHAPQGVGVGKSVWVGLQMEPQPGWHTYWKNPGDSGLPTTLTWTLPTGVLAGDVAWPTPHKISIGDLVNFGYKGEVLLPVPLTITSEFKPPLLGKDLEIKLKASWLICSLQCIPQDGEFALKIPVQGSTALYGGQFEAVNQLQPTQLQPLQGSLPLSTASVEGQRILLEVRGLPGTLRGQMLDWFPETPGILRNSAKGVAPDTVLTPTTWTQKWDGELWRADLPLDSDRVDTPKTIPFVLVPAGGNVASIGWQINADVRGIWPPPAARMQISPALAAALEANAIQTQTQKLTQSKLPASLMVALLGAFLGGLILNLMPCVLPVLAIKVMGFAQHVEDRRAHAVSGGAYTAGVLVSFLALGGLMLGLRAAGAQLGWGFQLQSPAIVAGLAALFTLLGLNLAGMFEFEQLVPSRLVAFQTQHPTVNAFLSGVLAVAVASPCTAPFMGAALGIAVTLPATHALLVFAAIGMGMALPYLLVSLVPAAAKALPRPGVWMDTLRKLMAFPMLATVLWLVWVLGQQSGVNGAVSLMALLLGLAFLVWSLTLKSRTRLLLSTGAVVLVSWVLWVWGPLILQNQEPTVSATQGQERWQPWSASKVDALVSAGQPVFVDFTAAWCVTCQYNKKTTLENASVLAEFDARNVALLRADWTRRDPAITQALSGLGRNGVPVYVLYQTGRDPVVLSEILSTGDVLAALAN